MNNKQLAVEWFTKQLETFLELHGNEWEKFYDLYSQAKQMEKEQIIDAVDYGCSNWGSDKDGEEYYNETYKMAK